MRNLKITLMLLALVGLLAVAGCGGDDDSSGTTATESSTTATDSSGADSDYAQQLSTILQDFGTSFQSIGTKLQGVNDPAALSSGIDDLESQIQTTISDLEALDVPEGAQEGQDQIVAALKDFSSKITSLGDAVDSGDKASVKTAAEDLQASAASFMQEFSAGLSKITESGIQVGSGIGG